jgi:hypothetical protein
MQLPGRYCAMVSYLCGIASKGLSSTTIRIQEGATVIWRGRRAFVASRMCLGLSAG